MKIEITITTEEMAEFIYKIQIQPPIVEKSIEETLKKIDNLITNY